MCTVTQAAAAYEERGTAADSSAVPPLVPLPNIPGVTVHDMEPSSCSITNADSGLQEGQWARVAWNVDPSHLLQVIQDP